MTSPDHLGDVTDGLAALTVDEGLEHIHTCTCSSVGSTTTAMYSSSVPH